MKMLSGYTPACPWEMVVQSSMVRRYSDPSDYIRDFKWSKADFCITARGQFSSKRTRISLPRVLLHRYSEELPRVGHIDHAPDRALFMFATRTDRVGLLALPRSCAARSCASARRTKVSSGQRGGSSPAQYRWQSMKSKPLGRPTAPAISSRRGTL